MAFDLHAHTTASDGTFTPAELVHHAKKQGLTGIGITDHDTADGILEAQDTAARLGLTVVPGVELGTTWKKREVHILGYFIDTAKSSLEDLFQRMKDQRFERMRQMVIRLQNAGIPVSFDDVLAEAGEGVIGRPHLARVLVAKGIADSLPDAFGRFLSYGKPGYVERPKLSPEEAVKTILAAGGVPVLAHPGLIGDDSILASLLEAGLQGIEASHPDHTTEQRQHYADLAQSLGLLATGGSDFHGKGAEHRGELGSVSVSDEVVEQLRDRANQIRNGQ